MYIHPALLCCSVQVFIFLMILALIIIWCHNTQWETVYYRTLFIIGWAAIWMGAGSLATASQSKYKDSVCKKKSSVFVHAINGWNVKQNNGSHMWPKKIATTETNSFNCRLLYKRFQAEWEANLKAPFSYSDQTPGTDNKNKSLERRLKLNTFLGTTYIWKQTQDAFVKKKMLVCKKDKSENWIQ